MEWRDFSARRQALAQSLSRWQLPPHWRLPGAVAAVLAHRRVRVALAVMLSAVLAALCVGGVAWQTCGFGHCPDVERLTAYRPGGASVLLDRNGQVVGDLAPDDMPVVRLAALPGYVPAAFLAIEDQRFYFHGAIDWRRAFGALAANLRARAFAQGFSTITMQLARNVYPEEIPGQERTTARKLLEIRVAQGIEGRFRKPEILELYLNHIYFGNGAHGIESAAQQYFGVPASRLTLAQAALLAALPKAPSHYDPRRHAERALARRNLVLERLGRQVKDQRAAAEQARQEPLGVRAAPERGRTGKRLARYFVDEVRRQLEERFGDDFYAHPVRVRTTLDIQVQRAAEEELDRQLRAIEAGKLGRFSGPRRDEEDEDSGRLEGAVVMLETATGDVLAWVGGRDYEESRFDRVAHAHRQAGSAWKPFVYAAALERGYALSQPLDDTPFELPLDGRQVWSPRNFDGKFEGRVSMREALVRSKNVPTVRLGQEVGYPAIAELARRVGISEEVPMLPSMPLGTVEVSPLDLTAAYTALSGLGQRAVPRLVLAVDRPNGERVWQAPPVERRTVLDPAVAYLLDDVLSEALRRGSGAPGVPAGFTGPAAGKTGTSNRGEDVWFIGYTPEVTAGVWIGFDQPRPIANQATGGRLAAPVWGRLMSRTYADRPAPRPWPVPPAVVPLTVDRSTGLVVPPWCGPAFAAARGIVAGAAGAASGAESLGAPAGSSVAERGGFGGGTNPAGAGRRGAPPGGAGDAGQEGAVGTAPGSDSPGETAAGGAANAAGDPANPSPDSGPGSGGAMGAGTAGDPAAAAGGEPGAGADRAAGAAADAMDAAATSGVADAPGPAGPAGYATYRELFIAGREPVAVCPGQEAVPSNAFYTSRQAGPGGAGLAAASGAPRPSAANAGPAPASTGTPPPG
jgi:penicillin-binding protein 1A